MINRININLEKFRGNNSTLYYGRFKGETVRVELLLNNKDKDIFKYNFIIPDGTTSFNPSFYLGLLSDSIEKLGFEKFNNKYQFVILSNNPNIISVINDNINDGEKYSQIN